MIRLDGWDLAVAASLVLLLGLLSGRWDRRLARSLLVAALRTTVQLLLVGLVLRLVFQRAGLGWVTLIALVMLAAAAREVRARQHRPFRGGWGFGIGALSMFLSSFSVTLFALLAVVGPHPWYQPQYAIPLLGMMLGNTMTGVALGLDRFTQGARERRPAIEARLMLGFEAADAVRELRRDSLRSGLIPIINSMAAAGLISLPGMMTGQILAGSPPVEAVKYQVMIMFLVSSGTGLGVMAAVWVAARRLFDQQQRLRLDRLA